MLAEITGTCYSAGNLRRKQTTGTKGVPDLMAVVADRPNLAELEYKSQDIDISELRASPLNPRQRFDADAMDELVTDIQAHGILEPLVVRPTDEPNVYEIVAGERRYRAAQTAGFSRVPVRIALRRLSDVESLELGIAENLRRANLDPIETAKAYDDLARISGKTQGDIADLVGKSQPVVSNTMRLLKLPTPVQQQIRNGELSGGHGVRLARFEKFPAVAEMVAALAVNRKGTVSDLDSPLPYAKDIIRAGLAFEVGSDLPFAKQLQADKDAYIKAAPGSSAGYYLNLERYQTVKSTWEEAEKQRQAKLRESAAGKPGATAAPAGTKRATNPKMRLPMLDDLAPDTFVRLEADNLPDGCSADCPCRGRALLSDGNTEAPICIDKRRYNKLAKATAKSNERQLAEQRTALEAWLENHVQLTTNMGGSEAAVMFGRSIMWYDEAVNKALIQLGIELPENTPVQSDEFLGWVAGLGIFRLMQLQFVSQLRSEINGSTREMPLTRWYLNNIGATLPEPETAEGDEPEDENEDGDDEASEEAERAAQLAEAHEAMYTDEGAAEGLESGSAEGSDEWPPADVAETEGEPVAAGA